VRAPRPEGEEIAGFWSRRAPFRSCEATTGEEKTQPKQQPGLKGRRQVIEEYITKLAANGGIVPDDLKH